jgi:hypothetical protein
MGKYIGYLILLLLILFALEWFQVVDLPFLEIPDFMQGKHQMIESTEHTLDKLE